MNKAGVYTVEISLVGIRYFRNCDIGILKGVVPTWDCTRIEIASPLRWWYFEKRICYFNHTYIYVQSNEGIQLVWNLEKNLNLMKYSKFTKHQML